MQRRILPVILIGLFSVSMLNWGCNKLDTTDLGSDLLPAVDNVKTFADTLNVITTQGVFNDTTIITRTDDHAIGVMNDPLFGQTTAGAYFQLKPGFYPYFIGNANDTLVGYGCGLDSVVLCLKYKRFYGDSALPLQLQVREVVDANFRDSVNKPNGVNYQPTLGSVIGTASIDVSKIGDMVHYANHRDSSVGLIRIKLSQSWANQLYSRDSVYFHAFNNAFYTDSLFRRFYNGLAVVPSGSGNQLVYVNLSEAGTRLEIHYRRRNNGTSIDTTFASFALNSDYFGSLTNRSSNTANNIVRNRPGLPSGDQEIYLQTAPGTYANLSIPGLATLSNRIIHRAELIVEQIPDLSGYARKFIAPPYLYLDLKDAGVSNYKPIYFDLNPSVLYDPDYKTPLAIPFYPNSGVDYLYFGGFRRDKVDNFGNPINYYNFNISKYVQDIVTNHKTSYPMRLFAPFRIFYQQYSPVGINYNNSVAFGRVKVGGGNNPNYRMRVRIIYSNL
ncbi:MAG: DUF4270 family protein [Sphingobacteriales bacterium]|nr:DUF4270 family protein [Sphingobacteriales bacterium]